MVWGSWPTSVSIMVEVGAGGVEYHRSPEEMGLKETTNEAWWF